MFDFLSIFHPFPQIFAHPLVNYNVETNQKELPSHYRTRLNPILLKRKSDKGREEI